MSTRHTDGKAALQRELNCPLWYAAFAARSWRVPHPATLSNSRTSTAYYHWSRQPCSFLSSFPVVLFICAASKRLDTFLGCQCRVALS